MATRICLVVFQWEISINGTRKNQWLGQHDPFSYPLFLLGSYHMAGVVHCTDLIKTLFPASCNIGIICQNISIYMFIFCAIVCVAASQLAPNSNLEQRSGIFFSCTLIHFSAFAISLEYRSPKPPTFTFNKKRPSELRVANFNLLSAKFGKTPPLILITCGSGVKERETIM